MWRKFEVNAQGHLVLGGCNAVSLAQQYGTPVYIMEEDTIRKICRGFTDAIKRSGIDGMVCYASKAFTNKAMCRLVQSEGMGLDCVSGGEFYTAIQAGFPAENIYLHGNNKGEDEIAMALEHGVGRIVVDALDEIGIISRLAQEKGRRASISLRVKPGIEAHTHEYIETGKEDSKFGLGIRDGMAMEAVKICAAMPNIDLVGLHCHIGSQIFSHKPFEKAAEVMCSLASEIRKLFSIEIREINFGGGYGIHYIDADKPMDPGDYVELLVAALKKECTRRGLAFPRLVIEPGRSIVGEAGTTLYTIGAIKELKGIRKYVSVDGGMADNPRTALYQAKYTAVIANKAGRQADDLVSIAGKCCESGDMLIWDTHLQTPVRGDILAIFSTGAYNYSMASNYNRLGVPPVVLVKDGKSALMVKRQTHEDVARNDVFPDWL
jgi:diaminopimelate decarboxylase